MCFGSKSKSAPAPAPQPAPAPKAPTTFTPQETMADTSNMDRRKATVLSATQPATFGSELGANDKMM